MDIKIFISNYIFIGMIIISISFFILVILLNNKDIKSQNNKSQIKNQKSQNNSQIYSKSNENKVINNIENTNENNNIIDSNIKVISSQNTPTIMFTNDDLSIY